jgi:hypothetical protein
MKRGAVVLAVSSLLNTLSKSIASILIPFTTQQECDLELAQVYAQCACRSESCEQGWIYFIAEVNDLRRVWG